MLAFARGHITNIWIIMIFCVMFSCLMVFVCACHYVRVNVCMCVENILGDYGRATNWICQSMYYEYLSLVLLFFIAASCIFHTVLLSSERVHKWPVCPSVCFRVHRHTLQLSLHWVYCHHRYFHILQFAHTTFVLLLLLLVSVLLLSLHYMPSFSSSSS